MARDPRIMELLAKRAEDKGVDLQTLCADAPDLLPELSRLCRFEERLGELMASFEASFETSFDPAFETASPAGQTPERPAVMVRGYRIVRQLAQGGMGRVYLAEDRGLDRQVALKVIIPDRMTANLLARFQAEAKAAAKLDHPNIVPVFEVGEASPPEGGPAGPYLAMEYVPGGTLEERAGTTPMAPSEAARVVCLLARAVAHAHGRGVVHRDLKPANVLIAPHADEVALNAGIGRPKVTDFGLAWQEGRRHKLTSDGALMGTPAYMAPEQAEGEPVGRPADVYALGMILYRLLTGRVAFESQSMVSLLHDICNSRPRPLKELVPGIPDGLEEVCLRCLAKEPENRPTAAELASALEDGPATERLPGKPVRPPSRRRMVGWVIGVGLAAAVAGLAVWQPWRERARHDAFKQEADREKPTVKRLWLDCFSVDGGKTKLLGTVSGELGEQPLFKLPFGTHLFVHAEFTAPAHAFLIELNAKGTERLLWPVGADKKPDTRALPPRVERIKYPDRFGATGRPVAVILDDEPRGGLQGFAVVLSAAPLPSYEEWRRGRDLSAWRRMEGVETPYVVDGEGMAEVLRGRGAVRRSDGEIAGGPELVPLAGALSGGSDGVLLLAVPVEAKR